MGQVINVEHNTVGDSVVFSTDRSITGQSGWTFTAGEDIPEDSGFAGELARRLFASDASINHVWVASNTTVVRRSNGWTPESLESATEVLSEFFVFYDED